MSRRGTEKTACTRLQSAIIHDGHGGQYKGVWSLLSEPYDRDFINQLSIRTCPA